MLILLLTSLVTSDQRTHSYQPNEEVTLWFNKVLPFHNPQETYAYSRIPLCKGEKKEKPYVLGLGEAVEGYELQDSGMEIKFLTNIQTKTYCELSLTPETSTILSNAIQRDFWLQMYLDDLPVWSPLGSFTPKSVSLYTHHNFLISYNNSHIIEVKGSVDKPIVISNQSPKKEEVVSLTYSVAWVTTEIPFEKRFDRYLDPGFFENNIHWFSIVNSFAMVLLLCGIVIMILFKNVKTDYAKVETEELEPMDFVDAVGWKQVSGDVFRRPDSLMILTGLISTGWNLNACALIGLVFSIVHPMYSERGAFATIVIVSYSCLGIVGGLVCGYYYSYYRGKSRLATLIFGCVFYPIFVSGVCLALNSVAIAYSSSAAIPFVSMVEIASLFLFVYCPLYIIGFISGQKLSGKFPCTKKVNTLASPILKEKEWYSEPMALILAGGLLPFGSISVEIYFIFTSFWNYKFYYVYGFALLGSLVLSVTIVCVTIVITYVILNSQDYKWHWVSYLSSGSIGIYLYCYSFYYYLFKTKMDGYFEFAFYFGYTGIASVTVFLMAGAIGYTGAHWFVSRLYKGIKFE